ncbi:hypothetical protein Q4610_01340 [Sphingobium sp. HBC34]|uniref:DUF4352 domain-containing protein n=1 Tax=Sphingobium cyanobacteriorum TaxID=3063954 RepID=A0ABT8ZHQ1_9SPHN|nr:hypothetical protein [Sphingobium sp. HBC34]MDO7833678.1 hypothetical protein [Sphingobium sp. HBC34]
MYKPSIFATLLLLSACGEAPISQTTGGEATVQPEAKPIALGETGKAAGVEITIDTIKTMGQIGPAGIGPKAEPTETFVVVKYRLKNTADKALGIAERPALSLADASGQSYAVDDMVGAMAMDSTDAASFSVDLNPGVATKAVSVWKIAKAGFDKATWKVTANTDPAMTFALQ